MEQRGCSHLHFISVIRGAEVVKVPNISRAKKVLKFKNMIEIYVSSECHDFLATKSPEVNRSLATSYEHDKLHTEIKIESTDEESELDFGAMTLKQLQDTSKSKKRKRSKCVNFTAVKKKHNGVQHKEDEIELKETLGSLKRKLFKKRKAKRNCITKCASISSETNGRRGTLNNIPSEVWHEKSREIYMPMRIKVENAEPGYSQPQAISCILSDDPGNITSETLGAVDPGCLGQDIKASLEDLQNGYPSGTSQELLVQPIPISVETQSWSTSQLSYEQVEYGQIQIPLTSEDSKIDNIIQAGGSAVLNDQSPVLPVSELGKVEDMNDIMTCDEAPETVLLEYDSSNALRFPPCIDKSVEVQGTTNGCRNVEFIDNVEAEVSRRTVRDCNSTVTSDKCLPSPNDPTPKDTLTYVVENKQLSTLDVTVSSLNCSPAHIQPCDAIDEVTGSATSESYEDKEVAHHPERLFSSRKTISPNSQQRLCKAMNMDLQDGRETNCCKKKLLYENDCKDRCSSSLSEIRRDHISKRPEALKSAENTTNSNQTRKGKDERNGLRSKGIVKGPHASHISQRAGSSCNSVQSCSQNAIKFSQQQMHDIERLAMKLVTEVQSMKEIVVDALHCDSSAGAKLRYNTDEVRVAVENATRIEEMTRKWLSIMTRDCNRFCKIMTLAEANAVSPEKAIQKERKKIVFADEAGGRLCHVRVFEALEAGVDVASPVESQITKEEILSE